VPRPSIVQRGYLNSETLLPIYRGHYQTEINTQSSSAELVKGFKTLQNKPNTKNLSSLSDRYQMQPKINSYGFLKAKSLENKMVEPTMMARSKSIAKTQ